jgi:hypothetical protein
MCRSFGADISPTGKLIPLTPAVYLDIPNVIGIHCGPWSYATGAEDPRLYWSEDMRPMLSYIQPTITDGLCRSPVLWEDLRLAWPALASAMSRAKGIHAADMRTLSYANIVYEKASQT